MLHSNHIFFSRIEWGKYSHAIYLIQTYGELFSRVWWKKKEFSFRSYRFVSWSRAKLPLSNQIIIQTSNAIDLFGRPFFHSFFLFECLFLVIGWFSFSLPRNARIKLLLVLDLVYFVFNHLIYDSQRVSCYSTQATFIGNNLRLRNRKNTQRKRKKWHENCAPIMYEIEWSYTGKRLLLTFFSLLALSLCSTVCLFVSFIFHFVLFHCMC